MKMKQFLGKIISQSDQKTVLAVISITYWDEVSCPIKKELKSKSLNYQNNNDVQIVCCFEKYNRKGIIVLCINHIRKKNQ